MRFARIDQSPVARWWWTVDRWSLTALIVLMGFGVVMSLSASPAVAERIGYDALHFVRRYLALLPVTIALMFVISLQTPRTVRRIAFIGFGIGIVLLALTFVVGADIKGARRWINFPLVALQPSEFVKPCFAVVSAWLFSEQKLRRGFPGNLICAALMLLVLGMLIAQPDIGMAAVVATVWFGQFYMAGLRLYWVGAVRPRRGRGAGRRLYLAAACQDPGRSFSRPDRRRQLPGHPFARSLCQWRIVGSWAGRGHGQICAALTPMPISSSPSSARNSA